MSRVSSARAQAGERWLTVHGLGAVTLSGRDRHRGLTWLAAGGLVVGVVMGTVGVPPLPVHGPTHDLGIMLPTCGMTRGVARASVGDLAGAWRFNPGSVVLVVGAWAVILRALLGTVTRRWLTVRVLVDAKGWALIVTALVALTVNQQLNAAYLR